MWVFNRALLFALLTLVPGLAVADPPDRLDSYRLVPGRSTLVQTGGFAGVEQPYRLTGGFDFARLWEGGTPTEPYRQTARFLDAEVWGAPIPRDGEAVPAIAYDIDQLLNLEGLRGELYPILGAPFDVYRFRGLSNDGVPASPLESSTIELYTALVGPWMLMYGVSTPPPGSADYFEYELRAVARTGTFADLNGDGVVDAADYTTLRDGAEAIGPLGPGGVSHSDWMAEFGSVAPSADSFAAQMASALSTAQGLTVPEPASIAIAFVAWGIWRRR